ncbi:MAG: type IV secretion system DNA-binding domain-containing protein [Actinobacteria bacterium]|nr:type IV secretion system DNA-binding domain-containing protein [Actinomycetota bacterium]
MKRTKLTDWFELRWPRNVEADHVVAALSSLSGLPHGARLLLEVSADHGGISHRLATTEATAETVAAALRAAIPSLRLTRIDTADDFISTGFIWQLDRRVAAVRTDHLPATSAALLSSLFPLKENEAVSLRWHVRPGVRPVLPLDPKAPKDGRQRALRDKLASPGLMAYGELTVSAGDRDRHRELFRRVAAMLWSLGTPHGHLIAEPRWFGWPLYLLGRRGRWFAVDELAAVVGFPIGKELDLPGLELGVSKRLVPTRRLATSGRVLGPSNFGTEPKPVALSAKAATKGTWVLGPTGTGKTSLLKNLIADDLEQGRGGLIIETNGDLVKELADSIPESRREEVILLDPLDPDFAVGFNPFNSDADPSLIADQLGELFQRLWQAFWGPRTAQLSHMALLTLARKQGSTLLDVPRLFLDESFRATVLKGLDDPLGLGPDWQWFESLSGSEQTTIVSPLLNKARSWVARPAIRAVVGQAKPALNFRAVIERQQIVLCHLPKGLLGVETSQLLGCLILTAAWQAFAERAALAPGDRHPFGIWVDEVQDFASAPIPWEEMLAQGRKYGVALTVAHQNITQLPRDLREIVLANARTKIAFALSGNDAKSLEKVFSPALSAEDLQNLDPFSIAAIVALDDGGVSRPVTLQTPAPLPSTDSFAAVQQHSRQRYGRKRSELEAELRARVETPARTAPIGRKRRSS